MNNESLNNDLLNINTINLFNNIFFINLKLLYKKINIYRSFNDILIEKKIKLNKIFKFEINIEYNFNLLLINEILFNDHNIKKYENKYLLNFNKNENELKLNVNDIYLNLFIVNNNNLGENEFIELNFE